LLVTTVPAFPSLWGPHDVINCHRRRYTVRTLRATFARAQLPPPRVTHFNAIFFPLAASVRWTRRAAGITASGFSDVAVNGPGRLNDVMATIFGWEAHLVSRMSLPVGVSLLALTRTQGAPDPMPRGPTSDAG
jgi:hypothetical protein